MRIDSAIITGSFSVNGDTFNDLGVFPSTGSNTFVGNQSIVGAVSASALTGSINYTNLTNVPTLVSGSEQIVSILSPLNLFTASNSTTNTFTSSTSARLNSIEIITASNVARLTSLEAITGSLATTGSNTFIGTQTITGSLFISSDLVVQGSSSLQNITASAVSIGTNLINLNTANPAIRYAGLVIGDSGSVGGSGSFLYDSVQDEMIFVHRGASTVVTSSVTLMGPQTFDNVGNETYPTLNIIQKGTGNEHLVDSCIFDNGTTTCIKNNLVGTGTITGNTIYGSTAVCSLVGKFTSCVDAGTGYFSGNVNVTVANTPEVLLTHSNTSKTFLMAVDGSNAFFRANSTNNILFQYAGGTTALTINGSTGAATFNSSIDVTTSGSFGFQDYRTQATQKVLVLRGEGVSGNYAPSLFNIYTKPGTTSNGIASLIIKSKYGSEAESGNLFEFKGDGSATFSNKVGVGGASATYSLTAYNSANGTTAAFGGTARGIRIDNDGTFSSGRSTIYGVDNTFYNSYQPLAIGASELHFSISGVDRVSIASSGVACFSGHICAPSITTTGANSSIRGGDSALFRGSVVTQSGNNVTFDAFRFLNPTGGVGGAASSLNGRLFMSFSDTATGGNQVSYQYLIITTGNGVSPGPFCFALLYSGPVRGTNPISSISLVNDGEGGAVKVRATTAASGVAGASAHISFVGTAV